MNTYLYNLKQNVTALRILVPEYIAVQEDPIDQALADYIQKNKHSSDLKLLFVRVAPSTYYVGNQKIQV